MNDYLNRNFSIDGRLNLELLKSGYARKDSRWHGAAIRSQYSRLYFIKRGSFFIIDTDGHRTEFCEGGIYLIPSGYSYSFGCDEENEQYYFHIRLFGYDHMDLLGRFKKPVYCRIQTDYDRLSKAIHLHSTTASLVIQSEIYRVLSEIAINNSGILDAQTYSNDINNAIDYISAHLSAHLTISEIAKAVNLANSTLSSKFRREVGMSVGEYIDYRVILVAMQMLISSESTILEISNLLGFCDQFYFSRRFKKRYGVSPQHFRKMKSIH